MSALDTQVGGDHYKRMKIQPIEYIQANGLGYEEGNVIKYISRYKFKDGIKDLKKIHHYVELLIERLEKEQKGEVTTSQSPDSYPFQVNLPHIEGFYLLTHTQHEEYKRSGSIPTTAEYVPPKK